MKKTRGIEIFAAGCPACSDVIQMVRAMACPSCEVEIVDVIDVSTHTRVTALDIASLPAVVIDGRLAACCKGGTVSKEALMKEGDGVPLN